MDVENKRRKGKEKLRVDGRMAKDGETEDIGYRNGGGGERTRMSILRLVSVRIYITSHFKL